VLYYKNNIFAEVFESQDDLGTKHTNNCRCETHNLPYKQTFVGVCLYGNPCSFTV